MSIPLVTVLINTYNHERFIEQAVVSVLEQDFPASEMEVLVVDDGSTDRTPEIVQKFEPRVRLIRKANGGQASAFNVGITQSQGAIVAFLDGDDWWTPSKLREVVGAFQKNPEVGVVGHGYYEIDLDAQKNELVAPDGTHRFALNDAAGVRLFYCLEPFFVTSRLGVRKEVLDRILPVPEELVFSADGYIIRLAVAIAGAVVLDHPLCYYRVHSGNLWMTRDPDRLRRRQDMQDRLEKSILARLPSLSLPREVMAAYVEPSKVDWERSHLLAHGGKPWRTFQLEWATYRTSYVHASFGDKVLKALILGLTLIMSPRCFYQFKNWLRRYRDKLGIAVGPASVHIRRESVSIHT